MTELNSDEVLVVEDEIVRREGNLPYVAEHLTKTLGKQVLETDVITSIVESPDGGNGLVSKLRILSVIKMYDALTSLQFRMMSVIDDLTPGEVAKTYTAMMTAFNNLTVHSTKEQFDLDLQAQLAAQQLNMPVEEVKKKLKELMPK